MPRTKFSDRALAGGVPSLVSGADRAAFHFRWSGFTAYVTPEGDRVRVAKADDFTASTVAAVSHILRRELTMIDAAEGDAWIILLGEAL